MPNLTGDQLELFADSPFSLRLPFPEALRLFWEFYWKHLPSAKSTRTHFKRLESHFRGFYLDTITKSDVEGFRRSYRALGLSESTTNKAHMILTRIYNKMHEYREAGRVNGVDFSKIVLPPKEKNPGKLVKKVNEKQFARKMALTKQQVFILAGWAKQAGDHDLADIILGLYWSRLRQSDFFRLTKDNVDVNHGLLQGVQHKTITTNYPSGVPYLVAMSQSLADLIGSRLDRVKPGTALFRRSNLQKRFGAVRQLAGMPYATLQDLRRSAATHQLDNGIDPQTVAEGLGHTTLRMLPTYTPRTMRHHREAAELLESA